MQTEYDVHSDEDRRTGGLAPVTVLQSLDVRDNLLTYDSVENLRERSARMDWRSPVEVLTSEIMLRNIRRRSGE